MSDTIYKNHAIHNTVKQILSLQEDEELSRISTLLNDDQKWQLERMFEIARVVEGYLDQTPSTLILFSALDTVQSGLSAVLREVSDFRTDKNVSHLTAINNSIDQSIIPYLNAFAIKGKALSPTKIAALTDDLRARSHEAIKALTIEKEALEQRIASLNTLITAQETQIGELSVAVAAQKKEAVAVTAVVEGQYAKTEKELRAEFDAALLKMKGEYKEFSDNTTTKADAHLEVLNSKEEKAKELVQIIGNIGVTGNYQKSAEKEGDAANFWRGVTVVVFIIAIVVGIWTLYEYGEKPSLEVALIRMLFAVVITFGAVYTGRESARHRTNSDNAKRVELELASLGPYLDTLPKDKQDELKEKLAPRYFGNVGAPHEVKSLVDMSDGVAKVVK
jgi:hypothetical protein